MSQIVCFIGVVYIYILLLLDRSGLRNLAKTFRMCLVKLANVGYRSPSRGIVGMPLFIHPYVNHTFEVSMHFQVNRWGNSF